MTKATTYNTQVTPRVKNWKCPKCPLSAPKQRSCFLPLLLTHRARALGCGCSPCLAPAGASNEETTRSCVNVEQSRFSKEYLRAQCKDRHQHARANDESINRSQPSKQHHKALRLLTFRISLIIIQERVMCPHLRKKAEPYPFGGHVWGSARERNRPAQHGITAPIHKAV